MTVNKPSDTILIVVEGGIARVVTADGTLTPNAVIVDYDTAMADPETVATTVHGDDAYIDIPYTTTDTELVEWVDEYMENQNES